MMITFLYQSQIKLFHKEAQYLYRLFQVFSQLVRSKKNCER